MNFTQTTFRKGANVYNCLIYVWCFTAFHTFNIDLYYVYRIQTTL